MLRRTAVCLLTLAALFSLQNGGGVARGDELLHVTSNIHYAVNTDDTSVSVTWDISLQNNDPETQYPYFYEGLSVPILAGATDVSATSAGGGALSVIDVAEDIPVLDQVQVVFDRGLFYGDSYDFTLSYRLPETRNEALLVIPAYFYVPLVTLGDEATVTVSMPGEAPWESAVTEQDCEPNGDALQCSGSEVVYVAGWMEVSRPDLVSTIEFDAPLAGSSLAVDLTFFHGEEATADHQRAVIQAALPLIEEVYGFAPELPSSDVSVSHGGRQAVFGYEGVTLCVIACEIVISPIASDQTLIHELAHLWSGIYNERWLSEGFAEWVAREVAARMPELVGEVIPYEPTNTPLQLDEWGYVESLLGADEEYVAITAAGYDLSLRFIQALAEEVGADGLRAVNQRIAEGDTAADSQIFMDGLEEETGINPDHLFLLWVFPDGSESLLQERRETRERFAALEDDLAANGFPDTSLGAIRQNLALWQFTSANSAMDAIDADLDRYALLQSELESLLSDADMLGVVLPDSLASAIERWEFDEAEDLLESASVALGAYERAVERVNDPRSLWQKFGLIGDDPDSELDEAKESLESGAFSRSREHSEAAIHMVDGAAGAAAQRVLLVAAVLGAIALALAVAYWYAISRQRRFGEEE